MFFGIKGQHIEGHKQESISNGVFSYLNPKFVYFPLINGTIVHKQLVQVGDKVKKGQPILERVDRFGHPVVSSVSGTVTAVKKMWHVSGKMVDMLEIENDFEESVVDSWGEAPGQLTRELIIERVKNAGIVGLGGAGFPTYVKYQPANEMDLLIVNAAECEPYITCDFTLILNNVKELINGIKYAMIVTGASHATIAIKNNKVEAIGVLTEAIYGEPNISLSLIDDVYPAGWEKYLVEHITKKSYNSLPSEVGCVVNNVQTLIAVSRAVEQNIPLCEKMMTFAGPGLLKPCNVIVKIGTLTSEVIELLGGYTVPTGESYFVVGGPMTGKSIMFDNVVVAPNLSSVIVMPKLNGVANQCMGCGKCADNCPAKLTPTEIKRANEAGDMAALVKLNVMACVQCGMCSYVCPSRVEMMEAMGKAKDAYAKYLQMKRK